MTVTTSAILTIYESFDSNNILDILSLQQLNQAMYYQFNAIGDSLTYSVSTYGSVSNYYTGDIPVTEHLTPISPYTRPGLKMSALPVGLTNYNTENIYWIVVHDTANTAASADALMHANYMDQIGQTGERTASWHYTVDENSIYQQIPDDERAYHAGDGHTLVGENGNFAGGGNTNGISIEMCVNQGSDIYRTWQKTAKLVAQLLVKYNLPLENFKYHFDFSGKDCPHTLRDANLTGLFEQMVAIEYQVALSYGNAQITMTSNNPQYLDNTGRIIKIPIQDITVSYDITVTYNGVTQSRTFYTFIKGISE